MDIEQSNSERNDYHDYLLYYALLESLKFELNCDAVGFILHRM